MKLAELFLKLNEAQYQIAGPVRGDELPLVGRMGDNTEVIVNLRDKRIDMDNARGIVIRPKYTEAQQTQFIQKNLKPGMTFMVAQPNGQKIMLQVVRTAGNLVIGTDPYSPDGAEVRVPGNAYYVDIDNADGMIHFENERSRAEKYSAINRLGPKAVVTVESVELEEEKPCWDGYKQIGMKKKKGKKVPNCVPEGKSPHKKGTKAYKKHMAAMHANM